MKSTRLLIIIFLAVFITGCTHTELTPDNSFTYSGANQNSLISYEIIDAENRVPEGALLVFKDRFASSATDPNTLVEITFEKYSVRADVARALVGIFAGTDNITSNVVIKDKTKGTVLGKARIVTSNISAQGSTKGYIHEHADKIMDYVKTGKT